MIIHIVPALLNSYGDSFLVEDRSSCTDFDPILFFIDCAIISSQFDTPEVLVRMKERFFDSIFNSFSLFIDGFIEVFSSFSKSIEDKDGIFDM